MSVTLPLSVPPIVVDLYPAKNPHAHTHMHTFRTKKVYFTHLNNTPQSYKYWDTHTPHNIVSKQQTNNLR